MDDDSDLLDTATSVLYRTCVGKLLFAAKDRVDLAYAAKELASRSPGTKKAQLEETQAWMAGTWRGHWTCTRRC